MSTPYIPLLKENNRVRLTKAGHRETSHPATVIRALENPSRLRKNQWYDVRFENGVYGRFQERYLERIVEDTRNGDANLRTDLPRTAA